MTEWDGKYVPIDELPYMSRAADSTPDQPTHTSTFDADGDGRLTPVDGGVDAPPLVPPENQGEGPSTGLTAQDILDRAKGVGINATIDADGQVVYREGFTCDFSTASRKADEANALVRETLQTVGLTTDTPIAILSVDGESNHVAVGVVVESVPANIS